MARSIHVSLALFLPCGNPRHLDVFRVTAEDRCHIDGPAVIGGKPRKGHKTYPYLLGGLRVDRP
ncbi:hypothetical protein Q9299_21010, partial [Gemmobacter fulvus]|uniref:hypothetical protein n=1 Tax=Gemmobacter fulvus TaxID=2840474 RepID=UPI002796D7D1